MSSSILTLIVLLLNGNSVMSADQPKNYQSSVPEHSSQPASRDTLFDLLSSNENDQDEAHLTLSAVKHYSVSWSAVMSFSPFHQADDTSNNTEPPLALSYDSLFWDHESIFQFQLQMSCPKASRLIIGLVDDQGRRKRTNNRLTTTTMLNTNTTKDDIACGPPIDMARNAMICRGISNNNPQNLGRQRYQFVYQTDLKVTCLAYREIYNPNATSLVSRSGDPLATTQATTLNTPNPANDDDDLLGLVLTLPEQGTIKTHTNLILTESLYATRITNLTQYLEWQAMTGKEEKLTTTEPSEPLIDGSKFQCLSIPRSDGSQVEPAHAPGLCSRQMTCYYSAPLMDGSCTSSVRSMSLSSMNHTHQRRLKGQQAAKLMIPSGKQTSDGITISNDNNDNDISRGKVRKIMEKQRHLGSLTVHQTRYRVLWTAVNFGCDEYPLMMDVSCRDDDSVTFLGTTPSPSMSNAVVECYQSFFHENSLHCRLTVPSAPLDRQPDYQEVVAIDIQCTQTARDASQVQPTVVVASVQEAANIRCHHDNEAQDGPRMPSKVGSAWTVVPVTGDITGEAFPMLSPPPSMSVPSPDEAISERCLSTTKQDKYDFYVNYDNSIGNKVKQVSSGCQSFASCHYDNRQQTGTNQPDESADRPQGCISRIAETKLLFEDKAQFLARTHAASSSRPPSRGLQLGRLPAGLVMLFLL